MHRQSLGSSVGKLLSHDGGGREEILPVEDSKRLKDLYVSSSPITECYEENEMKASKRRRFIFSSSSSPNPEKFIHIIPILMVFCFIILYLCSQTPSQSDLAQFHGFKSSLKHKDSSKTGGEEEDRFSELPRGKIFAVQSFRNLQGIAGADNFPISRSHRKMADF